MFHRRALALRRQAFGERSYILVSHDRYFISKTANKIWEIVDEEIKEFKGTYQEWVEWNERMEKQRKNGELGMRNDELKTKQEQTKQPPIVNPKPETANPKIIDKDAQKELQKLQRKLAQTEEQIEKLKADKLKLEADMGNPANYADKNKFASTEAAYKQVLQQFNDLNKEYETIFEAVVEMEERM